MLSKLSKVTLGLLASTAAVGLASAGNVSAPAYTPDLLPSNPSAGECYARVEIPAQYRSEGETVLVRDAYTSLDVTETQLRTRQEQVLVKEPSVRYEVRQPTYRSVTEQVLVRPAYEKLVVSQPQFSVVAENVQVSQSRLVWKRGNPGKLMAQGYKIHSTADGGIGGRGYSSTAEYGRTRPNAMLCGDTCEIWCLVEAPGESVSYNRKVLTAPAQVQRVPVAPKYQSITKQVVAEPGSVREIPIPAEYRSITVEDVVSQGGVREVNQPALYGNVNKRVLVSPERYEWRRVVCAPGTHPNRLGAAVAATSTGIVSSGASAATQTYSSRTVNTGGYTSGTTYGHGANVQSSVRTGSAHQPIIYGSLGTASSGYVASGQQRGSSTSYQTFTSASGYGGEPQIQSMTDFDVNLPTYSEDYTKPARVDQIPAELKSYESKRKRIRYK